MRILITGVAGFIGSAVATKLLAQGEQIIGIDNLNNYYDVELKKSRLAQHDAHPNFSFQYLDIIDREAMAALFAKHAFDAVIHLAAQAGVRYSIQNPYAYIDANLLGFANILENCRQNKIKHLLYASSSSVYGTNTKLPFSEQDSVDHPVSLYAATKRANELMAHSYAHLYQLPCTGLRFFTVYGPWGRPDMALFSFTRNILAGLPIQVFNHGNMMRDFTYIDDIVEGVVRLTTESPQNNMPYHIYNIGNREPVQLKYFIEVLEQCLGQKASLEMVPMQAGDVPNTYADVSELEKRVGALPHTPIEVGIAKFVEWYRMHSEKMLP